MLKKLFWLIPSFVTICLGLSIIVGWMIKAPLLVVYSYTNIPPVFNTGILFIAAGVALFCVVYPNPLTKRIQVILGCLIIAFALTILSQDIFDYSAGIDQMFVKAWFYNYVPYPGRPGTVTLVSFILIGLYFVLLPYTKHRLIALMIECVILTIFFIGIIAAASYLFEIKFLYSWYSFTSMSILTAFGILFIGCALWVFWRKNSKAIQLYQGKEDQKITLISAVILLLIGLIVGLACFISLANEQISLVSNTFQQSLKSMSDILQRNIMRSIIEFNAIVDNSPLFESREDDGKTFNLMDVVNAEKSFISNRFTAVNLMSEEGKLIAQQGEFVAKPELSVKLNLPNNVNLLWQNGWYVRIARQVHLMNHQIAYLTAEWPLGIDVSITSIEAVRKTSAIVVCTLNQNQIICFPYRDHPTALKIPLNEINPYGPMHFALQGKSGVLSTYDREHRHIMAAYQPVDRLNLYMFFKVNMSELYAPITEKIYLIAAIIIFGVIIGLALLRLEIVPLLRRVVKAEQELLKSNKRLRQSEERYALAVRGSNAGLWDWQIVTNSIFYSPYLKNMLGYTNAELPDTLASFKKNIHPDDRIRAEQALREHIIRHIPYMIEYRLKRKSGEYGWFRVAGQAIWDKNGKATRMAGSIQDVTERKLAEKRQSAEYNISQILSKSSKLQDGMAEILRSICLNMDWDLGSVWLVDDDKQIVHNLKIWCQTGLHAKQFIAVTRHLELTKGKGIPGIVWDTAKAYWSSNLKEEVNFPRVQQALECGLVSLFAFPIMLQNKIFGVIELFSTKAFTPDEEFPQMMAVIAPQVGQFIQRKQLEHELKSSEAHKTAILNSANDSIITVDEQGVIISYNTQAEKMFGYDGQELKNKCIQTLLPGVRGKIKEIASKAPSEFTAVNKKGDSFPSELSVSIMSIGNQAHYVIIVRDITERKKIETLKNEFVSVVSHELRTPITSIRGSLGLILGGAVGQFSEKANKLLNIANNNCERLLHLISDILDIEKIEAGKMSFQFKPVDIVKIVKESITANQMYGEKFGVKIVLTDAVNNILVNVDTDRFMQVMTNLISNAVKFSPSGEAVRIAIKNINNIVRVSVADVGPGIPEEFRSRIFQKFSQADSSDVRKQSGTGLGLSISKAIVERLGGTLAFTTSHAGTTFYFDLKVWDETKIEKSVNADAVSENDLNNRLLICDDDEAQASSLKELLQEAGFVVDTVTDTQAAKQLLTENTYKALLLDLILPDQDGIAFIRELRDSEKNCKLPIIVTSVIAQTGKALVNGDVVSVVDWLDKPVDFSKLLKSIGYIKNQIQKPTLAKVLHVEDDVDEQQIVKTLLNDSVNLTSVTTLQEAKIKLLHEHYDLVILDLVLSDGNATELMPLLAKSRTPVLVFSALELDKKYADNVHQALVKSETSHVTLVNTIKDILENNVT